MNSAFRRSVNSGARRAPAFCALLAAAVLVPLAASAQNTIATVAGGGSVNGPAMGPNADIPGPNSVARDAAGNTYIADPAANEVFKVDTSGNLSVFAGLGYPTEQPLTLDGKLATMGSLNAPSGVAVDGAGNVYIADTTDYLVRKVNTTTMVITTLAGNTHQCSNPQTGCGDRQPAISAYLSPVYAIATDAAGNVYIADSGNQKIRVVNTQSTTIVIAGVSIKAGTINTVAGNGIVCASPTAPCGDGGSALSANLHTPQGIAVDAKGNIYIADTLDHRVRVVSTTGTISAYAGTGIPCNLGKGCGDGGPANVATLGSPWQLSVDASGDVFIADPPENRIREVSSTGTISSVAGTGVRGFAGDNGPATAAQINASHGVFIDAAGNLIISDTGNQRIRVVNSTQTIAEFAGGGSGGDGGSATSSDAILAADRGVALDSSGNFYIADTANNRIREVSGGVINTIVGTGAAGYSGDKGPALSATLNNPDGLAVDAAGNVYIADTNNLVIRLYSPATGNITTIAGTGKSCTPTSACGDGGPATSATFSFPTTVSVDSAGNYYIADEFANRIRKVDTTGTITTVAGTGMPCTSPLAGQCGDGGSATSALLASPFSAVVDAAGNIYIADSGDNRVRKVDTTGVISAYAFTGKNAFGPDKVPALQSSYNAPQNLALDPSGNLYVSGSTFFYVIQRIDANSAGNTVSSVAGRPGDPKYYGFLGDGTLAIGAEMNNFGVAVDGAGHVYVADGGNNRVREISISATPGISPVTLTFPAQNVGTTSAPMSFKINNGGSDDLILSSVTITGDFQFVNKNPCIANQIAPGLSCTFMVTFTPTADGTRKGLVTINDNGYQDPIQKVYLTGTGQN